MEIFPPATLDITPAPSIHHGKRGKNSHVSTPTTTPKDDDDRSRRAADLEEEKEEDRNARIRAASLGAIRWLIGAFTGSVQC